MTSSQSELLTKAEAQSQIARDRLDAALASGEGDTQALRESLAVAQARVEELRAIDVVAAIKAEAQRAEARRQQAMTMAEEERVKLQAEIDALLALAPVSAPTPNPESVISLLAGRERDEQSRQALAAHQERLGHLEARKIELEAKRQALIDRRLLGDQRQDDARDLELMNADLAGLVDLITRTQAEAPTVTREAEGWERHWREEIANARRRAIAATCTALDSALAQALARNRADIGKGGAYYPSHQLRDGMSRYGAL